MPVQKHLHKLKRLKYKTGNSIYFCTLDCTFKIECALALGKKAICNLCLEEFVLNEYSIKLALPHCDKCSKRKVTDSDGRKHYIRRDNIPVLDSVAEDKADSLRNRLAAATGASSEDDI